MPPKPAELSREDQSAAVLQAAVRGRNARKTDKSQAAQDKVKTSKKEVEAKKKSDQIAKEAAKAAERQRIAENTFADADQTGDGAIDAEELATLLVTMLKNEKLKFDVEAVNEFVKTEFDQADTDNDGQVDFDEFVEYYNSLMDRMNTGEVQETLKEEQKKVEVKHSKQDDEVAFDGLHKLLALLSSPSISGYAGLKLPFTKLCEPNAAQSGAAYPKAACGMTNRGMVIDLSRGVQRIITPWGTLPLGYKLDFPGFTHEGVQVPSGSIEPTEFGEKTKDPLNDGKPLEATPLFFELAKRSSSLLTLRKLPKRCHFLVVEVLGTKQPRGEVLPELDAEATQGAGERYAALHKSRYTAKSNARVKAPAGTVFEVPGESMVALPDEGGPQGRPMINQLLDRCVLHRPEMLDAMKKRKEVFGARTKPPEEDLLRSLLWAENSVEKGVRNLQNLRRNEDNLVTKRGGHSTRAQVRYALHVCAGDEEASAFFLTYGKEVARNADFIAERRGLASGLGFPTRQEIEKQLVLAKNEEGHVMSGMKRSTKAEVEMMADILAAAQVEDMLTKQMSADFEHAYPATLEEREHVESLYHGECGRDKEKTIHFLGQTGLVLKRSDELGKPKRAQVEALVRELGQDAQRAIAFLKSMLSLAALAGKNGHPSRDDCARYLRMFACDEALATTFMKKVWQLTNPKPPKQQPKKPPKEHLAAKCGFPSRSEAEWALMDVEPPMDEGKAVESLMRLGLMTAERDKVEGDERARVERSDMIWALRHERALIKLRPLEHEEYVRGETGASLLVASLSTLNREKIAWGDPPQAEVHDALLRFGYVLERATYWLKAMGTLMARQIELGVQSREEVEQAMDAHNNDPDRVIALFIDVAALAKQGGELGNPSRADIKLVLDLVWESKERTKLAAALLKGLTGLMGDDALMVTIGVEGSATVEDKLYIAGALKRYNGDREQGTAFMKKVAEIVHMGEDLGHPSRETVIEALEKHKMDSRVATRKLREAYRDVKDAQLRDAYRKNVEKDRDAREEKLALNQQMQAKEDAGK